MLCYNLVCCVPGKLNCRPSCFQACKMRSFLVICLLCKLTSQETNNEALNPGACWGGCMSLNTTEALARTRGRPTVRLSIA